MRGSTVDLFFFRIATVLTYTFLEYTDFPQWLDCKVLLGFSILKINFGFQMDKEGSIEYGSIGENTCMGDHKVLYEIR